MYAYVSRRLANREAAEDVTSEVFHHALANLPRFEWRGAPFGAWLMRIASNSIADRWRRSSREQTDALADDLRPAPSPARKKSKSARNCSAWCRNCLVEQQKVVQMRFAEEKSIREIAQALGRTEGAVKQLQFRGIQTLREEAAKVSRRQGGRESNG